MLKHRVVLTGLGIVAPNGIGTGAFWESLLLGQSGIAEITLFDASEYSIHIAGEIKGFKLHDHLDWAVRSTRLARHTQLALVATKLALENANVGRRTLEACAPIPIVMGVSSGSVDLIARAQEMLARRGPRRLSPHFVAGYQPHAIAVAVADTLRVRTQMLTVSTACAAGLDAVAQAAALIRTGKADLIVTGGADAPMTPVTVAAFGNSGLVPRTNGEDPAKASRPFDRDRRGGVMAEGAAILVIERLEHALARGATPYLEILSSADSVDDGVGESGSGLKDSMTHALANACVLPSSINYVCAHGPSDPVLDRVETAMIKAVMGDWAYRIPVTSIKGATGNPLSAAGPLELATTAMIMRYGVVPPTTNYESPDPDCDLDYVAGRARNAGVEHALINVHGLGGGNSSMVVRRYRR